jgi:hypothetical protein
MRGVGLSGKGRRDRGGVVERRKVEGENWPGLVGNGIPVPAKLLRVEDHSVRSGAETGRVGGRGILERERKKGEELWREREREEKGEGQ